MMNSQWFRSLAAIAVAIAMTSGASAAMLAQWNFNAASSPSNPSSGTGAAAAGFGSGLAFGFTPNQTGSPGDPNPVLIGSSLNNAAATRTGAAIGSASGIRGVDVKTSTVGYDTPTISWHLLAGYRTSRYYQILATSDGTTYVPVPTNGVGSSATTLGSGAETSISATVSNSGLVTIITSDGLIPTASTGAAFIYPLAYTFPTGSVYDNNPNFGVRIVSIWDPNGTDYVSSFAGTTSADAAKGYSATTSAGGGSVRYDMITVEAVPEPTTLALAGCSLAFVSAISRRRREL